MKRIKEFLIDENKFPINKINFFINCLIIFSTIFYHGSMTYLFYFLIAFVMLKSMFREKYIKESKFSYFYLFVVIIIIFLIIFKLLKDIA